jgi:hypothetical protein
MKKCVKYEVSRKDGRRHCAKFENTEDVLVKSDDNFGIVVPQAIRGLTKLKVKDIVPPAVGGGGAIAGIAVIRKFQANLPAFVKQYEALFGGLLGALVSIPLNWYGGPKAAAQGMVSAAVVGLSVTALRWLETKGYAGLNGYGRYNYNYGRNYGRMGLLTTQPVGALPRPQETTNVPSAVQHQADINAYGRPLGI